METRIYFIDNFGSPYILPSAISDSVMVMPSDSRDSYVEYWTYFKTVYMFVFDTESGNYVAYASMQEGRRDRRKTGLDKIVDTCIYF